MSRLFLRSMLLSPVLFCTLAGALLAQGTAPVQPAVKPSVRQPSRQATPTQKQQPTQKRKAVAQPEVKFELPKNATVDELVDYLTALITFNPKTQEQAKKFQQLAPKLMDETARLVLKQEKDRNSDNYRFAAKYLLAIETMTVHKLPEKRQRELVGIVAKILRSPQVDSDDLDIAITLAESLEVSGKTQLAIKAYNEFSTILAKNKDPLAVELSPLMAGASRRLGLLGKSMQVVGTTLDGKSLDWRQYRGKVVLVDFWATWCGPCLRELPNVRKAYVDYHNKGFEVVGISMDEDRAQLDEFMSKNPMPWSTLHEGKGTTNPTAVHYGISALPTSILVDQSGKVVSMDARGEDLTKLLQKLLGSAG